MFWKSGEANRARGRRPDGVSVWSVTRRFTLLYAASTALLLLLAAGYLDWALARSLHARDQALVLSKANVLRLLLREHPDATDLITSEVSHEAGEGPLRYYLRVLDEPGRVLIETPGMQGCLRSEDFPPPAEILPSFLPHAAAATRRQGEFLLLSAMAEVGAGEGGKRELQVALDISQNQALLATYRRRLTLVVGLGLVFGSVIGAWLARKGAEPLRDITERARQVTANRLQTRLQVAGWPAELAQLGIALNAMLDRLEESFNRLSGCAADLAHELRTPINNLRGEAEVALGRCRTPEEYQAVLASNLEEYERLSRMIDGLLFIARADNPRAAVERRRIDVRKEVEAVRDFYEALAGEQSVAVRIDGGAAVEADAMLFRRAVGNVLANALRHTPKGGQVQIGIRAPDHGGAEVTVRDTGCGIAPEDLPRVFDRFFRSAHGVAREDRGTGLGLPIVQSIMRLHGGTVSLDSLAGRGTTVVLRFPGTLPREASGPAEMQPDTQGTTQMTEL